MTEAEKAMLLLLVQLHEQVTALSLLLAWNGLMDADQLSRAQAQAASVWSGVRRKLQEPGAPTLADILRNFEGPLQ